MPLSSCVEGGRKCKEARALADALLGLSLGAPLSVRLEERPTRCGAAFLISALALCSSDELEAHREYSPRSAWQNVLIADSCPPLSPRKRTRG
ncbi:hypothetical protein L1887_55353 [Cichorium endivia]|nr:hypothetical protein L1887_55353 [Cichorium endivia]